VAKLGNFVENTEETIERLIERIKTEQDDMFKIADRRLFAGITEDGWAEKKLAETTAMRRQLEEVLSQGRQNQDFEDIFQMHKRAYHSGQYYGEHGNWQENMPRVGDSLKIPKKVLHLELERSNALTHGKLNMLRSTMDGYRTVIADTVQAMLLGTKTSTQALQAALNKFSDKGITGFVDKAGKHWDLTSYTEMALRTSSFNAARIGALDRIAELGSDYVQISSHGNCCPLCAPYEGERLAIDSANNPLNLPTLDDARANGLFHPNCKHMMTAWIPGTSPPVLKKEYNPEAYKDTQLQRYNERQIRKYKGRENVALTDTAKADAKAKVRKYQARQRELLKDYESKYGQTIKRRYDRERIRPVGTTKPPIVKPPVVKPPVKPPIKPVTSKVVTPKAKVTKSKVKEPRSLKTGLTATDKAELEKWNLINPDRGTSPRTDWIKSHNMRMNSMRRNAGPVEAEDLFQEFSKELQKRDFALRTITNKSSMPKIDFNETRYMINKKPFHRGWLVKDENGKSIAEIYDRDVREKFDAFSRFNLNKASIKNYIPGTPAYDDAIEYGDFLKRTTGAFTKQDKLTKDLISSIYKDGKLIPGYRQKLEGYYSKASKMYDDYDNDMLLWLKTHTSATTKMHVRYSDEMWNNILNYDDQIKALTENLGLATKVSKTVSASKQIVLPIQNNSIGRVANLLPTDTGINLKKMFGNKRLNASQKFSSTVKAEGVDNINDAIDWLNKYNLNLDDHFIDNLKVCWSDTRAYEFSSLGKNAIKVAPNAANSLQGSQFMTTYIHEMSHAIHMNSSGYEKTITAWFKRRIAGNSGLEYGPNDLSKKEPFFRDKFIDTYIGRFYGQHMIPGTEVASMGQQYIFKNPTLFYNTDKDMFNLIYGLMNGLKIGN